MAGSILNQFNCQLQVSTGWVLLGIKCTYMYWAIIILIESVETAKLMMVKYSEIVEINIA